MTTVEVFAPAKINLTLHVTGQREDGYHLLDSLVAFAPVGDRLILQPGNVTSLTVEGPEARGVPADMENIAMRAAMMAPDGQSVTMVLTKFLPVASGIGGGSADAAAVFRGMLMFGDEAEVPADSVWAMPQIIHQTYAKALLDLGADVPMCLLPRPLRAQGIGEKIEFLDLPALPAVFVNPRVPVSTPEVFRALKSKTNPPMPDRLPDFASTVDLIDFLAGCRNDLEPVARTLVPEIGLTLDALSACDGCELSRMSGSGATCFGIFSSVDSGKAAVDRLRHLYPDYWIAGGLVGDQLQRSMPVRK